MVGHWIAFHPRLAPQAKAVYQVMLAYAKGEEVSDGGSSEVWPAREAIAEAMGWSRPQSCDQWIDQLAAEGAIEVLPPEPGDADRNNHYIVHTTPPEHYDGPHSQAEFLAARRARKGGRKGDAKPQVKDDAVERTTQMDDAAERTTHSALDRTMYVRSAAHEQEPLTRTINNPTEPPQPPRFAEGLADPPVRPTDASALDRCPCGKRVCRTCGFNTTRIGRAEREAGELARLEHEERGESCTMCRRHGTGLHGWSFWQRVIPDSPGEPLLPITKCDHETPHQVVVKLLDEAEAARERAAEALAADRERELQERWEQARRRDAGGAG